MTGIQRFRGLLVAVTGLAAGAALLAYFVANRQVPTRLDTPPPPAVVGFVSAKPLPFVVEARGYGAARPSQTWRAVANVSGRVVERHPDLESGALFRRGTVLLALDPSRYELAIAEVEAELARLASELAQLETEEKSTRRLLVLERERLLLAEQELARIERLATGGSVSTSRRDDQRRGTLAQRAAVASLENTLSLMPSRRGVLSAQRNRAEAQLAQARRNLADTRFVAPYDLRLGEVVAEMHQFVGVGERLFDAESLQAAEVEAHFPIGMMRRLLGSVARDTVLDDAVDLGERIDMEAVSARLELVGAEGVAWSGRLVRVSSGLDPATRTVRAVVRVDHPYRGARPPDRPPLQRDMYLRVRLSARNPEPLLAVPVTALHGDELVLADNNDKLERRIVRIAFEQRGLAVIESGLEPGDRVVVDDLHTAIRGTPLAPRRDEELERRIDATAAGTTP
ncbi:MAG: efflux transporter periplasmic adaptor subunit [Proteobacteria bacterium]|nr:MAG: efflux transporter periplasmic adaptor subunit [Pseudomonadota bacterium]